MVDWNSTTPVAQMTEGELLQILSESIVIGTIMLAIFVAIASLVFGGMK